MKSSIHPVELSFEIAAARCEDLTTPVYARLFRDRPEARAMFRTEGAGLVQGSMLALTIEAILDFIGERRGAFRMIACEVASHEAYGTPPDLFLDFFRVIRDEVRSLLGDEWSPEIDAGWTGLLHEIVTFASPPT